MPYDWGYGAGDGEEYCSIPGYEGPDGYHDLWEDLGLGRSVELPVEFVNPKNGKLYRACRDLGSEFDQGYEYEEVT